MVHSLVLDFILRTFELVSNFGFRASDLTVLPNYLSIQVTRKKIFVKTYLGDF